ncbi:hypothetical protein C8J95_107153 [Elizabethkingia sp. YR214]|nr:hypothetical protein C8J95_107153 [Elizabethkingia sp. YR214]
MMIYMCVGWFLQYVYSFSEMLEIITGKEIVKQKSPVL